MEDVGSVSVLVVVFVCRLCDVCVCLTFRLCVCIVDEGGVGVVLPSCCVFLSWVVSFVCLGDHGAGDVVVRPPLSPSLGLCRWVV